MAGYTDGVQLEEVNVFEEESTFLSETKRQLFSACKEYDIPFTYSGGATAGNYSASTNVTQMGRTMKDGKFTNTVILTLHDLGLNGFTNYATLFQCYEMDPVLHAFTVFHLDFPCMKSPKMVAASNIDKENNDPDHLTPSDVRQGVWDKNLVYPSLDELAKSMVPAVMAYFGLSSVILVGTGVGANVATRYALAQPDKVMGLITLNPIFYQISWGEWFGFKTQAFSSDMLIEHILSYLYTGSELSDPNADMIAQTRQSIMKLDYAALCGLYTSFKTRTAIPMERPEYGITGRKRSDKVLDVDTCIIVGDFASNYMECAMEFNSLIDPSKSNFVKLADAGAVVYEEQPQKVAEAIRLFLQGIGYLATVIPTRLSKARSNSCVSESSIEEYNMTAAAVLAERNSKTDVAVAKKERSSGEPLGNPFKHHESPSKTANVEIPDNENLISAN